MSIAPADVTTSPAAAGTARSEDYLWTLNFGPQHPATHTTLRLVLKLDGERVAHHRQLHAELDRLDDEAEQRRRVVKQQERARRRTATPPTIT